MQSNNRRGQGKKTRDPGERYCETIVSQATQFEPGAELNANNNGASAEDGNSRCRERPRDGGGNGQGRGWGGGVPATSGRFANN